VPVHIVIYDLRVNNEAAVPLRCSTITSQSLLTLELLILCDFFILVVRRVVSGGVDDLP